MKIKRLHEDAILPKYASDGAIAFDLFAYKEIEWGFDGDSWTTIIPTGWALEIPEEYGLFVYSRSGHGFKFNTHLANGTGLIDNDYRGELMIKLICHNPIHPNITMGTAIAQCVLKHTPRCIFMEVDTLSKTKRGENGFGSTDVVCN